MTVSKEIRRLREARGLTQSELAKLARVHHNTINGIELGNTSPTDGTLARIATALGLQEDYFLQPDTSIKPVRQRLIFEVDLPQDSRIPDTAIPLIRNIAVAVVQHIALIIKEVEETATHNPNIETQDENARG